MNQKIIDAIETSAHGAYGKATRDKDREAGKARFIATMTRGAQIAIDIMQQESPAAEIETLIKNEITNETPVGAIAGYLDAHFTIVRK